MTFSKIKDKPSFHQIFQCSLTKADPGEASSAQSWLSQQRPVTPLRVGGGVSRAGRSGRNIFTRSAGNAFPWTMSDALCLCKRKGYRAIRHSSYRTRREKKLPYPHRLYSTCFKIEQSLSPVRLFATPRTVAYQAPPSMGFSRQEYWSGLPFPSPADLPNPGIEPESPALQADSSPSEPPGKSIKLYYPETSSEIKKVP